jgi:hypothetical protein
VKLAVIFWGVIYAATSTPIGAEARCYSRWYYPYPQNCSHVAGVYARTTRTRAAVLRVVLPPIADVRDNVPDIPLPALNDITWGGALDTELELALQRQKAIRQLTQQGN